MNDKQKTCCFSGHRPMKLPFGFYEDSPDFLRLKVRLYYEVDQMREMGVTVFLTGMAQGIDMLTAEIVLDIKRTYLYDDVRLVAVVPFEGQAERWSKAYRARYFHILGKADEVVTLQKLYTDDCLLKRNRCMVDASSHLIAVWSGGRGGTKYTVEYAVKQGLDIILINPFTLKREHIPSSRPPVLSPGGFPL
jgi:uncharacterized phage-like protein YoqJ